jgi:hypothetical protein
VINIILGFIDDFKGILFAIVGLLIGISVVQTWARTRSLAPTIGVVILGAVVLWGLASVDFIRGEVNEDVDDNNTNGGGANNEEGCGGRPGCRSTSVFVDPSAVVVVVDLQR